MDIYIQDSSPSVFEVDTQCFTLKDKPDCFHWVRDFYDSNPYVLTGTEIKHSIETMSLENMMPNTYAHVIKTEDDDRDCY